MLQSWRQKLIGPAAVAVFAAVWLSSGIFGGSDEGNQADAGRAAKAPGQSDTWVRTRVSHARPQSKELVLRGRTRSKRSVTVRAETVGQVASRPVENGTRVAIGDLLCQLELLARRERVRESQDAVTLATLEYEGLISLREQGLQRELSIAESKSRLSAAQRQLAANQLELTKSAITAPLPGFVEETHAEVGDYLQAGSPCATILNLDPINVEAAVTEQHYRSIQVGSAANLTLVDGRKVKGAITFVGKQSNDESRTFPIEISVPNPDFEISSGLSAEIQIPLSTHSAHRVSMSYVVLNPDGEMGVRTIDNSRRVRFHRIDVVKEVGDGLWVSGLPEEVTLITVGQEFVAEGERVEFRHQIRGSTAQ